MSPSWESRETLPASPRFWWLLVPSAYSPATTVSADGGGIFLLVFFFLSRIYTLVIEVSAFLGNSGFDYCFIAEIKHQPTHACRRKGVLVLMVPKSLTGRYSNKWLAWQQEQEACSSYLKPQAQIRVNLWFENLRPQSPSPPHCKW